MKTIQEKKLYAYFKLDENYNILSDFYYRNYQFFNRVTFLTGVFILLILFGFYNNIFFSVATALFVFISFLYVTAKSLAKGLEAERHYPEETKEGETIRVTISLKNNSSFSLSHFFVSDVFHGSAQKVEKRYITSTVAPRKAFVAHYDRELNAGMGKKDFGPLVVVIADPLGIFEFRVLFEFSDFIIVRPLIEQIKPLPVVGTRSAQKPGNYDLPLKGKSITFHGVREYHKGDPLSHIHWKLSLRRGKLVVKEFEKTVNAQVTLFLNMSSKLHMGQGAESTWEYMRDVALSISEEQLNKSNNIQLITNNRVVPFGEGKTFIQYLELLTPNLLPVEDKQAEHFIRKHVDKIPYSSTVFYLSPLVPGKEFMDNLIEVKKLLGLHCQLFVVLIDGISYMQKLTQGEQFDFFQKIVNEKNALLQQIEKDFKTNNVSLTVIPITQEKKKLKEYLPNS